VWVHPEDHKAVGEILAAVRKKRGITQEELSKRLVKPQSFVSAYETGQRRIDVLELILIASAIGIDPKSLFESITESHILSKQKKTAKTTKRLRAR
jgi:transcriptional regulator with XRE-family HTH domain